MRLEPESIPFPFSRLYLRAVARHAFFRDIYASVAGSVAAELREGAVLDLGCGPGRLALRLAELRPGLQVWGIDISRDMVRLASREAAATPQAPRLHFRQADAARLPFESATFDACVSTIALHHWRRPAEALGEAYRVLRPGGFCLICDFDREMSAAAIRGAAGRYGLKMYFLHAARHLEPFWSAGALGRLLEASAFERWRLERRGVLLWARLKKRAGEGG